MKEGRLKFELEYVQYVAFSTSEFISSYQFYSFLFSSLSVIHLFDYVEHKAFMSMARGMWRMNLKDLNCQFWETEFNKDFCFYQRIFSYWSVSPT